LVHCASVLADMARRGVNNLLANYWSVFADTRT